MAFGSMLNKVLSQQEGLRDYRHASETFVSNNLSLHPKYSFLFHVFIQLNPAVINQDKVSSNKVVELSLMVKTVDLPNFTIDAKTLNSYNRPNVVQNKIKYEPVTITFHDDSSNVVRDFWADYYDYYYRDSGHTDQSFYEKFKYTTKSSSDWGFTPRLTPNELNQERYIKSVRIFSFHLGKFSEYQLFNPMITNWKHGKHNQSEPTGLLEHSMTFQYEGMQYNSGRVATEDGQVTNEMLEAGFSMLHYDTASSPFRRKRDNQDQNQFGQGETTRLVTYEPGPADSAFGLNLPQLSYAVNGAVNMSTALRAIQQGDNRIVVPTSVGVSATIQAGAVTIPIVARVI